MDSSKRCRAQKVLTAEFRLLRDLDESVISYEEALKNADSMNEVRLRIKLEGKREAVTPDGDGLEMMEDESDATFSIG